MSTSTEKYTTDDTAVLNGYIDTESDSDTANDHNRGSTQARQNPQQISVKTTVYDSPQGVLGTGSWYKS
jgi:hypothetical protein